MSARRLALLGSKEGAWVSILGMPNPHLRVCDSAGTPVTVRLMHPDQSAQTFEFQGDGEYRIPEASFVKVSCGKISRKMICDIVSRRVA